MKKHTGFFLVILFAAAFLVCLAALDTGLYIHTSCRYRPNPTHIEIVLLIVPIEDAAHHSPIVLRTRTSNSRPEAFGIPPSAAYTLQYFDSRILHRLSLFVPGVSPVLRIVSTLQKKSVWHRYSDEDPLPSC
jgi:hypothetical protein